MRNNSRVATTGAALGMLLLILDSRTAMEGAADGLELCLRTVIPALFPFFVLSALLTGTTGSLPTGWLRPLGRLTGIPHGAESILLVGYLGGYPVGAKCIAQARHQNRLSSRDAARMMAFCNNAGPSFIFGMAGVMFDAFWAAWVLWGIQILSALTVGAILPGKPEECSPEKSGKPITITAAVNHAVRSMAGVCGWVLLFRVGLAFLNRWFLWLLPAEGSAAVTGLLELANGCCTLNSIRDPGARFVICSGILAFGGLCVWMQTASVAEGVSLKWYLPGKLLQTALAVCMAIAVTGKMYALIIFAAIILLAFYGGKVKISGRISQRLGV